MAALKEKAKALLSSTASVNMAAGAGPTTLYTVPVGKTARISSVVIRSISATLAGGFSYSFTNFRQNVDLSGFTATTGYVDIFANPVNSLLGAKQAVNMQNGGGPTTIYTTPAATVTRINNVLVKDPSLSLAGGSAFSLTGFRTGTTFSVATMTAANTDFMVLDQNNLVATEIAASTPVVLTTTTGATAAATATIEIYGYQEPPNIYSVLAAGTAFTITNNTGSSGAATATIDVFGYLT